MANRLDGRVAIVTGGASGIGAGITQALATAGAEVVVLDIDGEAAKTNAAVFRESGLKVRGMALDLGDEAAIIATCAEIESSPGAPWVLVNNAGLQDREPFLKGTVEEWERMQRVNARGPFLMSREIARSMIRRGEGGRIVNIASAALRGSVVHGLVAYTASKGALLGLSSATAFELAREGITVNTVLPGGVPTPGATNARGPSPDGPATRPPPLGLCQPEDIAAAVLYFASPAAARVTNQVLAVDGGFSVS
jgi:NAD(P)-dependent dehydrogenase (short-subunit alcohol dehydrogenase family)